MNGLPVIRFPDPMGFLRSLGQSECEPQKFIDICHVQLSMDLSEGQFPGTRGENPWFRVKICSQEIPHPNLWSPSGEYIVNISWPSMILLVLWRWYTHGPSASGCMDAMLNPFLQHRKGLCDKVRDRKPIHRKATGKQKRNPFVPIVAGKIVQVLTSTFIVRCQCNPGRESSS